MRDKYFSYDPEVGFETFHIAVLAQADAENRIDEYRENAADGWEEFVEQVCWGEIKQAAEQYGLGVTVMFDGEESEAVDYRLADLTPAAPDVVQASALIPCGGWCKHGVMEANRCEQCIEEWKAAGIDAAFHEGSEEEFRAALAQIVDNEGAPQPEAREAGPVAVVGADYSLFWIGGGPIAPIIEKHGIKVGDKLYAAPKSATEPLTYCCCGECTETGGVPALRPEEEAEQFIQAAIDNAPEPLRRLGEYLTRVLDEDHWPTAEQLLLGIATSQQAAPTADESRAAFEAAFEGEVNLERLDNGRYAWVGAATRWQAWQACARTLARPVEQFCDVCKGSGEVGGYRGGNGENGGGYETHDCPYCGGTGEPPSDTEIMVMRRNANAGRQLHASLCRRFDYSHDEVDWYRDLVSLEEHIARQIARPVRAEVSSDAKRTEDDGCPTERAVLQRFWREHQNARPVGAVAGGIRAWEHEDGERVISASTKAVAERDGGASLSSVRAYTVPLVRAAEPAAVAQSENELRAGLRAMNDDLCDFAKRWALNGDWLTCKRCKRNCIASRADEDFQHAAGCKADAEPKPWRRLITILAPLYAHPAADRVAVPEHDLQTSEGGRGFLAWFFANVIKRRDFDRYIKERLAADFACALSLWLRDGQGADRVAVPSITDLLDAADRCPDLVKKQLSVYVLTELRRSLLAKEGA